MSATVPDSLRRAAEHIRAGRPEAARPILAQFIKDNPGSEMAWLLLSMAVDDPARQAECLKQVLQLNPANAQARARLAELGTPPPAREAPPRPAPPPAPTPPPPPQTLGYAKSGFFSTKNIRQTGPLQPLVDPSPPEPPPWMVHPEAEAPAEVKPAARTPAPRAASPRPAPPPPPAPKEVAQPEATSWDDSSDDATFEAQPLAALPVQPRATARRAAPAAPGRAPAPAPEVRPRGRGSSSFVVGLLIGLLAMAAVAGGGLGLFYFIAPFRQAPPRTATPGAGQPAVAAAATAGFPTLPPVWTRTPSPTITPLPTATPSPTPSPFPTPNATISAEMDRIQQEVADVRGLPVLNPVARYFIGRRDMEGVLKTLLISTDVEARLKDQAHVLSALGLIKPTYDLVRHAINTNVNSLGGFYLPWTGELYVIGDRFSGTERFTYSHEFDHALTDQHFNIRAMGVYPACTGDAQRCAAIRALAEGDATLAMHQWGQQYASIHDYADLLQVTPPAQTLRDQIPPPYAIQDLLFPYSYGFAFVQFLHERGNWAEVNNAYADLPQTTEQIMHPEKYVAREGPIPISDPALGPVLGDGWREVAKNSLGEWMTYLILAYGADLAAQLDDFTALAAAEGWGGDTYQVHYHDGTGETVMAVHWVWDSQADADEFQSAMNVYQDQRFRGAKVDRADGQCWEANRQASCMFYKGQDALWLFAPNQALLDNVLAQYSNFP